MDEASRDAGAKYAILEETEKRSVVSALLEERSHLCLLVSCLKPVLVSVPSTSVPLGTWLVDWWCPAPSVRKVAGSTPPLAAT